MKKNEFIWLPEFHTFAGCSLLNTARSNNQKNAIFYDHHF
jgi:hypothetical protein